MQILAVDPGRWTGWAIVNYSGQILKVGLGSPPLNSKKYDRIVIERPQVYRASQSKVDPNDLITLALVAGLYWGQAEDPVEFVLPAEWKGQVPKDVCWNRVKKTLPKSELAKVEFWLKDTPESLAHNVRDAIGIGLWAIEHRGTKASKIQSTIDLTEEKK